MFRHDRARARRRPLGDVDFAGLVPALALAAIACRRAIRHGSRDAASFATGSASHASTAERRYRTGAERPAPYLTHAGPRPAERQQASV